jgi:signal transduction histidine kinase
MYSLTEERPQFLCTLPPGQHQRRLALAITAASVAIFLVAAPFAKVPLTAIPAFLPIYESALVLNDLITCVLLFGQSRLLRSRALLVLACGYLFSAAMAASHALTFPGLFAPSGLLNAGPQSTAWLYFVRHAGFPIFIIGYTLLTRERTETSRWRFRVRGIAFSIAMTLALVVALTMVTTMGHQILPAIMQGNRNAPVKMLVAATTWALGVIALGVQAWRRLHSVLDVWLMVVLCAWLFDSALSAVLNAGRYDVGWYVGRVYGLVASSFVLMVLLTENTLLHARLLDAHRRGQRDNQLLQQQTSELLAANEDLDSFSYSVSHDLRAPLRAVDGFTQMLEQDYGAQLDEEGRRLLAVVRTILIVPLSSCWSRVEGLHVMLTR